MEENVRIVVTGDNRDALKKLNKVEDAVNRLNSATKKVEVKVSGIQEAERQAARLYQALERIESAALSKLPRSLQTVIAYLKAANAGLGEFTKRAVTAAAAVGDIGRVPFAPIIKAQSQAIRQFQQMERGLVSLRVEFVRVFEIQTRLLRQQRDLSSSLAIFGKLPGNIGFGGGAGTQYYGGAIGPNPQRRLSPVNPPSIKRLPPALTDSNLLNSVFQSLNLFSDALAKAASQVNAFGRGGTLQQGPRAPFNLNSLNALQAELRAREALLRNTPLATKAFRELSVEVERLAREVNKAEDLIKGRRKTLRGRAGTALQSAALGGGFPLLFGGPSFSAAGGALGGLAGGLAGPGAGFALGIVGSALGSAIDTFVEKAKDLGRALRDPTENIDALVDALGTTGAASKGLITQLKALGLEEVAAATATELLNAELATLGVDADKFKEETAELDQAVKRLELAFTALATRLVPALNRITQIVSGFVGTNVQRATASASGFSAADAVQGSVDATLAIKRAEDARNEILARNILLERQITSIKQQSNKLTASQRADLQFVIDLQRNSLELAKLQLRFDNERNEAKKELLRNEILITLEKRKQIAADREAAAKRSIAERVAKLNEAQAKKGLIEAQTAQIVRRNNNLELSSIQRIPGQITSVIETANAEIDVLEAKIQNIEADTTLTKETQKSQVAILEAQINKLREQKNLLVRQWELTEDRLNAERAYAQLVTKNQQDLQLAQAGGATERARLQLANPFGGDRYEREIQRLDQLNEREAQRIEQEQKIAALEAQKTQDGADVAFLDAQIQRQEVVNEQLRNELLNRQALERQILSQQQALEKLQPVVDGLTAGFTELFTSAIDGSKSAQEVVADTFRRIGEAYIAMAAKIIAEQIAMIINEKILAALRGATGTGGIGSIFSAIFGGFFRNGGRPEPGKVAVVGENGPELFIPDGYGRIIPNGRYKINTGGIGGAPNTITVNVDARSTDVQGDDDKSRQLGTTISRVIQAELVRQQRPGGLLHSTR